MVDVAAMPKVPRRRDRIARARTRGAAWTIAGALAWSLPWSLGGSVACGPAGRPPEVNVAYGVTPPASAAAASASAPLWSRFGELASYTRANGPRFVSTGHFFARYDADVLVDPKAAPIYAALHPGVVLPAGAVVVKVHHLHAGDEPGPLLAIEKGPPGADGSGVRFVEMDSTGHVLRAGRIAPCVGCHAQVATQDELFGLPTESP